MRIVIDGKPTWVNYHHLYCFYVVAGSGSLSRASRELGIGQSALSIQMKKFEEQLGFALFERSHRKLAPNERGRIVLAYAREIFRLGGEMLETIHDRPKAGRTHLQIGALDTIPKHLTIRLVGEALRGRSCTVSVIEGKPDELLRQLTEHRIDIIVTNYFPLKDPGQVYVRRLARLPLWVVGGKPFLGLRDGFPKTLHRQPFVVPTGDSHVRHELENFCKKNELRPDFVVEAQDLMVQKLLALKHVGLSVMPEFAVADYLAKKELYKIGKLPGLFEELYLISASRKIENPAAAQLMRRFHLGDE